jgi:excinuclease ABC subunit C
VFGMVKDGKHRTRGLISPDGREIHLSATPAVFALVGRIQEETHRFAVEYHQTLRRTKTKASTLDKSPVWAKNAKKTCCGILAPSRPSPRPALTS